jgi:hypothetical protein
MGRNSLRELFDKSGFKICSVMRLLARALSLGRFSTVVEEAAADLVIAEAVLTGFDSWSSLASFFSDNEPIDVPRPLSAYLSGRRRGRKERLLEGSIVMGPSMMVPGYGAVAGLSTALAITPFGRGSDSSRNDCD